MKKIVFILLLLFIFYIELNDRQQPISITKISEINVQDSSSETYLLDQNLIYWSELPQSQKFKLILEMVNISEGALRFQIIFSDSSQKDSVMNEVAEEMTSISDCVDSNYFQVYKEFSDDVTIGNLLSKCMFQNGLGED